MIMNNITEVADDIVRRARAGLYGIRFIKAYRKEYAERPPEDFLAVVNLEKVESSRSFIGDVCCNGLRGEAFNAELRISLFAPYDEGGEALGLRALSLCDALRNADNNGYIEELYITGVNYDKNSITIYRDIVVRLGYFICEVN
jgi:hypothetical protein